MLNLIPSRPRGAGGAHARAIDTLRRFAGRFAAFAAAHEPAYTPPAERYEPTLWILHAR